MDEIEVYLKKIDNKIISAKLLFEAEQYSNVITLSYYAMFLTAKVLLLKKGFEPKTHHGLINKFGLEYVKNDKFDYDIFVYLSSTQSLREDVDYAAYDGVTKKIAKDKIYQAEKFLEEASKFL